MSTPETLFVYRLGEFWGEYRARCISCDSRFPSEWATGATWRGFVLDTASPVEFRQDLTDVTGEEPGPASVYAEENCVQGIDPNDAIALMKAQNYTYIVFNEIPSDIQLPFFISTTNPSVPLRQRVEIDFQNTDILKLPEVQEYERKMRFDVRDRWDAMLVPPDNRGELRLPIGFWLPVSFNDGVREVSGVYSVAEWLTEQKAIADVACSDRSVSLSSGCQLQRQFKSPDGHATVTDVGRVTSSADSVVTSH